MSVFVNNGPYIQNVAPAWLGGAVSDSAVRSYQEIRTKTDTRRKKPRGRSVLTQPTSYHAEKRVYVGARTAFPNGGQVASDSQAGAFSLPYQQMLNAKEAAKMACRAKIKGTDMSVSTFVGELPETVKFLKECLPRLVRTIRAVKHGNMTEVRHLIRSVRKPNSPYPKGFKRDIEKKYRDAVRANQEAGIENSTKAIAGMWLEWRYAVSPIIYDLQDALKVLYKSSLNPTYRRSVGGHVFEGQSLVIPNSIYSETRTTKWHVEHRFGAWYTVDTGTEAWKRLDLINPLVVLYELTPLSFVLDWFIPLGSYIASLDALAGVQILSTWISERVDSSMRVYPPAYLGTSTEGSQVIKSYSRVPNPSISLAFPSFKMDLNLSRFCDGLSLARNLLLKEAPKNYRII